MSSTKDAWQALARVMAHHNYDIRTTDTDSYNCRAITGGSGLSLHSYGIALDVNWETNPFIVTANKRRVRFSRKRSQEGRARDVKAGKADTIVGWILVQIASTVFPAFQMPEWTVDI